jgi:hypothetical protein
MDDQRVAPFAVSGLFSAMPRGAGFSYDKTILVGSGHA